MAEKKETNTFSNLFLDSFRKKNALLQQDVADFLGTSRGYISKVEKGNSKLSPSKIDMLLEGAQKNNWDVSDLVPAYSRLEQVYDYIISKTLGTSIGKGAPKDLDRVIVQILSPAIVNKIKYGEIGLNGAVAEAILRQYPEIDKQWLLDGTGEMLLAPSDGPSELEKLREEVRLLRASLDEYKEENKKLLSALPGLIAAEIAKGVSNK